MDSILELGIAMVLFLQNLGNWLTAPMSFFSFLGNEEFFMLIMPALYWSFSPVIGLRLGIILLMSASLNSFFKMLGQGPRPFWYSSQVQAYTIETSFGVPSGHAQNAATVWGGLAVMVKKTWFWIAAIALVFLIGLSRLYMGVHFPTDVLAGWLLGILFLVIYFKLEKPLSAWTKQAAPGEKIAAALVLSLGLILLVVLTRLTLRAWVMPSNWLANALAADPLGEAVNPLAISGVISNAGALFGLLVGAIFMNLRGSFHGGGLIWKRVVRFLIGVVGVLLIWRGLGAVLPGNEDFLGYIFRYLRYALIGFWIAGLAPLLFLRFKLADPPERSKKAPRSRRAKRQNAGTPAG
jgi:membrane-associated phospholipid phosphatase